MNKVGPATFATSINSPIGPLSLTWSEGYLTGLHLGPLTDIADGQAWVEDETYFKDIAHQLQEYFACRLQEFDVPLRLAGTEFQRRVWLELTRIPYGQTISYRELARRVGNPKACRAVGSANGRNPVAVIVPCHRVIAADGGIGGYGGGLPCKTWLLELERSGTARPV